MTKGTRTNMKRLGRLAAASALSALALAACGGDDEGDVRSVMKLTIDSDPARCDAMTRTFLRKTAGGLKECRSSTRQNDPFVGAEIERVAVDDDKATATVGYQGSRIAFKFVKQDGDWKLNSLRGISVSKKDTAEPPPKPKIRRGLSARATVDAYYQAIKDEDGAALCGLLSRRLAVEMRGGEKTASPIADCVEGLQVFDWSKTRKAAKGVKSVNVTQSGGAATVTLSHGKQALLTRHGSRWVIDEIKAEQ
jgi:hypothetical protein